MEKILVVRVTYNNTHLGQKNSHHTERYLQHSDGTTKRTGKTLRELKKMCPNAEVIVTRDTRRGNLA